MATDAAADSSIDYNLDSSHTSIVTFGVWMQMEHLSGDFV